MTEMIMAIGAAIAIAAPVAVSESNAWVLASMTMGETGLLFGNVGDAERWVMWTAMNRMASDAFPDDLRTVVEQGFYGHRRGLEPTAEMLALAVEVLAALPEDDPTGGCLYVMSGDDMAARGWSSKGAVWMVEGGRWRLYFFREMPR